MAIQRLVTADMPNWTNEVVRGSTNVVRSSVWARTGTYSIRMPSMSDYFLISRPAASTCYARIAMRVGEISSSHVWFNTSIHFMEGNACHIGIRFLRNGTINIVRGNGLSSFSDTGVVLATLNTQGIQGTVLVFEIYVKVHDTEGAVSVKINGVMDTEIVNVDTRHGGTGVIGAFGFSSYGPGPTALWYLDDIAIADDWPGTYGNVVLWPNGAGDNAQWAASAGDPWACVNGDVNGDGSFGDYIHDVSVSNKHDFAMTDVLFPAADIGAVYAVAAGRSLNGSATIRTYVTSDTTTAVGDDLGLDASARNAGLLLNIDPNTSAPWTLDGINALKVGVESRS